MKEEIKDLWVAALRSGEYQQGTGALIRIDPEGGKARHCCLGVLCELAEQAGVIRRLRDDDDYGSVGFPDTILDGVEDRQEAVLPHSVREWSGVGGANGFLSSGLCLSHMNDTGSTFEEIAETIEENWKTL